MLTFYVILTKGQLNSARNRLQALHARGWYGARLSVTPDATDSNFLVKIVSPDGDPDSDFAQAIASRVMDRAGLDAFLADEYLTPAWARPTDPSQL